jgi:ribosome biogenesis protein ENP2
MLRRLTICFRDRSISSSSEVFRIESTFTQIQAPPRLRSHSISGLFPSSDMCFISHITSINNKYSNLSYVIHYPLFLFQILSEDFSKLVFLRSDRVIEFHAQFGTYYSIRIPKVCPPL